MGASKGSRAERGWLQQGITRGSPGGHATRSLFRRIVEESTHVAMAYFFSCRLPIKKQPYRAEMCERRAANVGGVYADAGNGTVPSQSCIVPRVRHVTCVARLRRDRMRQQPITGNAYPYTGSGRSLRPSLRTPRKTPMYVHTECLQLDNAMRHVDFFNPDATAQKLGEN